MLELLAYSEPLKVNVTEFDGVFGAGIVAVVMIVIVIFLVLDEA